jgi:hypothetical protein
MPVTSKDRERLAVCVHEASHCVAAALLGRSVHSAVVPGVRSGVLGSTVRGFTTYLPDAASPAVRLATTLAGPWGEARWRAGHYPSRSDMSAARHGDSDRKVLAAAAQGRDVESAAERMVAPLLTRCWAGVTELALRLFYDGEVSGDDVLAVLGLSREPDARAVQLANFRSGLPLGKFAVTVAV